MQPRLYILHALHAFVMSIHDITHCAKNLPWSTSVITWTLRVVLSISILTATVHG